MKKLIHEDLSYKLIGVLYDVYNVLGSGFQEKYYQKAIGRVLEKKGIRYFEQVKAEINLYGVSIGRYYIDFIIDDKIVLEIKSKSFFSQRDIKQLLGYLKKTEIQVGILAAFTSEGVKIKRILKGK